MSTGLAPRLGEPIHDLLDRKGHDVVVVVPSCTVGGVLRKLRTHDIGAVVVSPDRRRPIGIVSERDVVRRLADEGGRSLLRPVTQIMSAPVITCEPTSTTAEALATMTAHHVRHLPVVTAGLVVGLVSMRDVCASYVADLETAAEAMGRYLTGSSY